MTNTTTLNQLTEEQLLVLKNHSIKTALAPVEEGTVNWQARLRPAEIERYWISTIGIPELEEDETIRITAIRPWMNGDKIQKNQITLNEQIRSAKDLIKIIASTYESVKNDYRQMVGFSISAGIFKYVVKDGKAQPPGRQTLRKIDTMVIDIDSHEEKFGGKRFHFNSLTEESRRVIAARTLIQLNVVLEKNNIDLKIHSSATYATGGGLQFHIKFEKYLNAIEADRIFKFIRNGLAELGDKKFTGFGVDALGSLKRVWLEFDKSCGDPTHTQRLGGTVNPKELYFNSFSERIEDFYNIDLMKTATNNLLDMLLDNPNPKDFTETQFIKIRKQTSQISLAFEENEKITQKKISYKHLENSAFLAERAEKYQSKNASELFGNTNYNIIKQIPLDEQVNLMVELIHDGYRNEDDFKREEHSAFNRKYRRYHCPFHEENDPSFAIYQNDDGANIARANDFHGDGSSLNLIDFIMAISKHRGIPKTINEVIGDLKLKFPEIDVNKTDQKAIMKEDTISNIDLLIERIDVDEFVYYRLANKQRACVIRSFKSGRSHTFDGTRMMSDHILMNQLGLQNNADMELRTLFHDRFVEKILINAFEEFSPGREYTYEINHIKYINLWIPGKEYLDIVEMSKLIDPMDIASAISVIKTRLPNMYFYLNQITQKGSIEYFVNWLTCISQFKVMSNIPIITSVQGTGKNLFVTEILERFLNHEYINVVNSEKMANNFNAFMEKSSLIVMDEGDFTGTHEINNIKMLSGNKWLQVEKKGIDSTKVEKKFNMIIMTNGETPMRHPSNDRRITYFRLDVSLDDSITHTQHASISDFLDDLRDEVHEFWAILLKTQIKDAWMSSNLKDNQFNKQILLMHPFGKLVIKILENDWTSIKLQINENVDDKITMSSNIEMIDNIQNSYESTGTIDLTLINKFIKSLNFKSFTGVQQFIEINNLKANGIYTITDSESVKIKIDKTKASALIYMKNNLGNVLDCYTDQNIENTMKQQFFENRKKGSKTKTGLEELDDKMDFGIVVHEPVQLEVITKADDINIQKPISPANVGI